MHYILNETLNTNFKIKIHKNRYSFFIPVYKMNYALLIRFATASQAVNQRGAYKVKVIRIKHNY